jgi:hypothetical protein
MTMPSQAATTPFLTNSPAAVTRPSPAIPAFPTPNFRHAQDNQPTEIDWGTILLGLLAVLTVGGLIPYWIYIYFTLNPIH